MKVYLIALLEDLTHQDIYIYIYIYIERERERERERGGINSYDK